MNPTASSAIALAPAWLSASSTPVDRPTLLIVDDDRTTRMLLQSALEKQGYQVMVAEQGEQGLSILAQHAPRIHALVLDREMPGIDGLEMVQRMKADPQLAPIPVIMLTGSSGEQSIEQGINVGVYYYLVKPIQTALLKSVIDAALRERRQRLALLSELNRHGKALGAMTSCRMEFQTLKQAQDTASMLASCFPNPERVVAGLMELLVNAVEHGNLGISSSEKQLLLEQNRWVEEVNHRLTLPIHADKKVTVDFQRKEEAYLVQITDSGPGFDWKKYWHVNPARATASHGRGIARARLLAFDRISYNEAGNSVTVMVAPQKQGVEDYPW